MVGDRRMRDRRRTVGGLVGLLREGRRCFEKGGVFPTDELGLFTMSRLRFFSFSFSGWFSFFGERHWWVLFYSRQKTTMAEKDTRETGEGISSALQFVHHSGPLYSFSF